MAKNNFRESFNIYRAQKSMNGVACSFDFNPKTKMLFLEMAPQTKEHDDSGNSLFGWNNKIAFKLGINDIGEILSVLNNNKNGVGPERDGKSRGLYHENQNGNSILYFFRTERDNFYLGLSVKKGEEKIQLKLFLTLAEAEILKILLMDVVSCTFEWRN